MNRFEIRDILRAHKEHFRVLPTLAQNELNGIIEAIDNEPIPDPTVKKEPVKKETPAKSFTTGRIAKKKAKKAK